jgi:hypothetical protein
MWTTPYVILRPTIEGSAKIVHEANDLKRTNYLLQYVAEPGDAAFQTPLHPKIAGGEPKYTCHTESRGKFTCSYEQWIKNFCGGKVLQIEKSDNAAQV